MSLVFLDTPQIDLLERVRRSDLARYSSFRDIWQQVGCTLVLTLAQESELRRYADVSRRDGRFEVLADLAPIRRDVPNVYGPNGPRTLIAREIVRSVVERNLTTEHGPPMEQLCNWTDVLPGRLNTHEAGVLRLIENEDLLKLFNHGYDAVRFSAAADRDGRTKTDRRVRDLPTAPLSTGEVLDYRTEIDKVIVLLEEQSRLGKLPPMPGRINSVIANFTKMFLDRAQDIGNQATLLEFLPVVRYTKSGQQKLTTDELVSCWVFETQVRSVARELLNASEFEQESLARTLDFADCPGSWLRWRLLRCVRRSSPEPRPNHHFDAERLAYLPYVDLLLTDAEMAEFVRQVRHDESTPARIRKLRPARAIASSMDALEEALGSLKAETHEGAASL